VNKKLVVVLTALVFLVTTVLAGCSSGTKQETGGEAKKPALKTLKEGVLTVGSDIAFPPFEFKDEKTQETVGFDIDLMQEVGKRIGLEVVFVNAVFDSLIAGLNAGKFDCIVSAMTITDERAKQVDFSDPYIDSNQSLAVVKGSPIKSVNDLKGKIVGVQRGTTGEMKANELKESIGFKEIKSYDDTLLAFEDLKAGRVDGVINDLPVSAYLAKKDGGFEIVEEIPTGEQYGIAFRKDSDDLREAINKALKDIKEDGTYDQIYAKWFGEK
jgi:lysine-arginine-ornithine-binding protein